MSGCMDTDTKEDIHKATSMDMDTVTEHRVLNMSWSRHFFKYEDISERILCPT
jgi:hypothetical protein